MNVEMRQCEQIARTDGLAAGCAVALSEVDVMATAPGRWAAVPVAQVPDGAPVRSHSLASREHVVFLECPRKRPAWTDRLIGIGRALAAVRLGVARHVLDLACEHLSGRDGGGEPLVRKQLVIGAIADAMTDLELLRQHVETESSRLAIADLHDGLDEVGWQITQLFGAAGYLADHQARALYVSSLVANTWVDRTVDQIGVGR